MDILFESFMFGVAFGAIILLIAGVLYLGVIGFKQIIKYFGEKDERNM